MSPKPESITLDPARARAVRPRGVRGPHDGRWYWRAEIERRTVWTGWGTRDEVRRILARRIADDHLEPADLTVSIPEVVTIRDLLDRWIPAIGRRKKRPRTLIAYRGGAKRIARSSLGNVRIDRMSAHALQWWVDESLETSAPKTVALDLQILTSAWRWGSARGITPDRALPPVDVGNTDPVRDKYTPNPEEVSRVLDALGRICPPWTVLMVELQVATGARMGEIADLTWPQVRLDLGTIEVHGKTGARVIPIPPPLVDRLSAADPTPWVLGVRPTSSRSIDKYLRRACAEAEVRPWTTHALRRLAVDRLARAGVDVATAAALLGHSPTVMLDMYRQVSDLDRRRAMAAARLWDLGSTDNVIPLGGAHRPVRNMRD